MTDKLFTPGPWSFASPWSGFSAIHGPEGELVFGISAGVESEKQPDETCEANAHLIASAPSMYDELVANNMLLGSLLSYGRIDEDLEHPIEEQIKANNLVIKSARGES